MRKERLEKEDWLDSYNLAFSELSEVFPAQGGNAAKGKIFWKVTGEGMERLYTGQGQPSCCSVAALEVHFHLADKATQKWDSPEKDKGKHSAPVAFGESAFPYLFNIVKYLSLAANKRLPSPADGILLEC